MLTRTVWLRSLCTASLIASTLAHAAPPVAPPAAPAVVPPPSPVSVAAEALCPEAWEMEAPQLQGVWDATIDGQRHAAVLKLGPHPEWEGTVKGTVHREAVQHPMVGDVDQGNVTLEESSNGTNITATWMGTVTDGSCAREVRGQLQEGDDGPSRPFILRKRSN